MIRLCLLLLAGISLAARAESRPNVVVVLLDDVGYGDFSCHGHPFLKTPHLDRLHAESVRLTDFHVAPMCSPTRGQLLTGCDALRNGVTSVAAGRTFLRPEFPTAPELLAAAGWRTGIFGKWHLGDHFPHRPFDRGFDTAVWTRGWGFTSAPELTNTLVDGRLLRGDREEPFSGHITEVCFDEAMRWMDRCREAGESFFCYLPLHAAHTPHVVEPPYDSHYAGRDAAAFFGMIAQVDDQMGRLETFLRERGLRDDTLLVFLTDNGGTAGVRTYNAGLRGGKVSYWDGGHRVPCFVRWPAGRLRPPGDLAHLTQVQDLLPTLLEFCQVKAPPGPGFDGISLAPLLRGEVWSLPERTLFVQYGPGFGEPDNSGPEPHRAAVMRGRWRLLEGRELYDLDADRGQQHDLAADHPGIVAALRADYDRWWESHAPRLGDFVPVHLGAPEEPLPILTSADWRGTYVDNRRHVARAAGGPRGGPWTVHFVREGDYEIVLRRWPFDVDAALDAACGPDSVALPVAAARLAVAGEERSAAAPPGNRELAFRLRLPAGPTTLQAWFQDAEGHDLAGAFFARVQYLGR